MFLYTHESKSISDFILCRYIFIGSIKTCIALIKREQYLLCDKYQKYEMCKCTKKVRKVWKLKQNMM